MTEEYLSHLPSIDRSIAEIPKERSRSKIIATIVDYSHPTIIINDGTDQLQAIIPGYVRLPFDELKVGSLGRFLIDVEIGDDSLITRVLAFHTMTKEQVNKYKQLVKIERSQSK